MTTASLPEQRNRLLPNRRRVRWATQCQWIAESVPNARGNGTCTPEVAILVFDLKYLEETIGEKHDYNCSCKLFRKVE